MGEDLGRFESKTGQNAGVDQKEEHRRINSGKILPEISDEPARLMPFDKEQGSLAGA